MAVKPMKMAHHALGTVGKKGFEQSKRDTEPKGMREGSKKEERLDARQSKRK